MISITKKNLAFTIKIFGVFSISWVFLFLYWLMKYSFFLQIKLKKKKKFLENIFSINCHNQVGMEILRESIINQRECSFYYKMIK